jgi:hypothetical protein
MSYNYLGLYYDDEYGTYKYLKYSKYPLIDDFKSFYEVEELESGKYKILNIIKQTTDFHNFTPNDIILETCGMITFNVIRENNIIYEGVESLFIINKKELKGVCDGSIDSLINKLGNKLKDYKPSVEINPYTEILEAIKKYNDKV